MKRRRFGKPFGVFYIAKFAGMRKNDEMSLTAALPYKLTRVMLSDGERRSYLIDERGLEDDYSALFVLATIRKPGLSVASQEAALGAVNVLAGFCKEQKIDLISRFRSGEYLTDFETEALSDFAQQNFGAEFKRHQKAAALGKVRRGHAYKLPHVARPTHFKRITHIAAFADWLAKYLLTGSSRDRLQAIKAMNDDIIRFRINSAPPRDDFEEDDFTSHDNALLNSLIEPGAQGNPFTVDVQLRNFLLVDLFRKLGVRLGEVLNVKVRDVDQVKRTVTVRRRHDAKDDPRVDQPLVKGDGRAIPISQELTESIMRYVNARRKVPGALKHGYLLVTHKSCPTLGAPMTKAAAREVFQTLIGADKRLDHLRAHQLRHFFNNELAHVQQESGTDANSQDVHRRVRNHIGGRKAHSAVDATYTTIETKRQARVAVLGVQERMAARASEARLKP